MVFVDIGHGSLCVFGVFAVQARLIATAMTEIHGVDRKTSAEDGESPDRICSWHDVRFDCSKAPRYCPPRLLEQTRSKIFLSTTDACINSAMWVCWLAIRFRQCAPCKNYSCMTLSACAHTFFPDPLYLNQS